MNISPISNKPNFNGTFVKSQALEKAIDCASDYDLKKFGQILRRMKNVDDKITYRVYSTTFNKSARDFTSVYLRDERVYKKTFNGIINSFSDSRLSYQEWPETAFKGALKKINKILEERYPEPEVTKADRNRSINYINKLLG